MNILGALILFGLAAYCGSIVLDGWRAGRMRSLFFGWINPVIFSRATSSSGFLITAVIDAAIAGLLALGGMLLLVAAMVRK